MGNGRNAFDKMEKRGREKCCFCNICEMRKGTSMLLPNNENGRSKDGKDLMEYQQKHYGLISTKRNEVIPTTVYNNLRFSINRTL